MAVKDKLSPEELKRYYDTADSIKLTPGWVGSGHGHEAHRRWNLISGAGPKWSHWC